MMSALILIALVLIWQSIIQPNDDPMSQLGMLRLKVQLTFDYSAFGMIKSFLIQEAWEL